jgi:hypothetical protein
MHLDIVSLCQTASEDGWGQLQIKNAFVRLPLEKLPVQWEGQLVARLRFEAGEDGAHPLRATITDPDGQIGYDVSNPVRMRMLPDESFGYLTIVAPVKWVIRCYGEYVLRIQVNGLDYATQFHVKKWPPDGR